MADARAIFNSAVETSLLELVFSSFNMRFRQQNIRAPEENACIAGYDLHGSM